MVCTWPGLPVCLDTTPPCGLHNMVSFLVARAILVGPVLEQASGSII